MYSAPATPQYAYAPPMPTFEGGGRVKDTYGLRNAAEQLRERGRGDDTILAHITPEEAGILKLLGGSGTINPYTGLPEYRKWYKDVQKAFKSTPIVGDIYKGVSSIGKEVERGVESIAKDKILGPIASLAAAYYGGPIGSAIYKGVSAPGSSFDTKGAIRAGATTAALNYMTAPDANVLTPRGSITDVFGSGMQQVPVEGISSVAESAPSVLESIGGTMDAAGSLDIPGGIGSLEGAVASAAADPLANVQALTYDGSGIGAPMDQYASARIPTTDVSASSMPVTPERLPTSSEQYFDNMMGQPAPYADVGEVPTFDYGRAASDISEASADPNAFQKGINTLKQGYSDVKQGISNIIPEPVKDAYDVVKDYLPDRQDIRDAAGITSLGTTVYGAYKTKQELDAQKAEAERVLADQANRTKEEIEFAQSVLRDYPYNYQRLTEEDIRRERGMAMGGRINSYDDEMGGDDGMMQGGIAALAKGGLPPRYLRGGGDGMSDSIRARIGGKQEARLADGEFVVPADVVSHLGNGSSNAGAKKLYAMMDRVRKSRTGKTRQAPEVNTRRLMPA
jgi:hypothetical protein